jgi:hypothetical protein
MNTYLISSEDKLDMIAVKTVPEKDRTEKQEERTEFCQATML